MDLLQMGAIGRAHGIRGEMGVNWEGETGLSSNDTIYLQKNDEEPAPWQVSSSRMHNGRMLLGLKGITDRTAAEKMSGVKIYLPRAAVPPLSDDEAFVADLPGCDIYLPDGACVGKLKHVEYPAGRMVWVIESPEGNEILFPAEPQFIRVLDVDNGRIVIDPPPGLLEIYSARTS